MIQITIHTPTPMAIHIHTPTPIAIHIHTPTPIAIQAPIPTPIAIQIIIQIIIQIVIQMTSPKQFMPALLVVMVTHRSSINIPKMKIKQQHMMQLEDLV